MPFETIAPPRGRMQIAVIGAGIAGLGAAHALSGRHQVTLFEAEPRLGGHARTVLAGRREQVPVDTGFIVFNRLTYPNLCALFERLGVPVKSSDMSFSARIDDGRVEYATQTLDALFVQRGNLASPAFLGMVSDILRFNREAPADEPGDDESLGAWISRKRYGAAFRDDYISALAGAIWSTSPGDMMDFPAATLFRFFRNHRLFSYRDRPKWLTVEGGSRAYVSRIEAALRQNGARIRAGAPVARVERGDGVTVWADGEAERFDAIVLACHSDQALRMLADPSPDETRVLGALRYSRNRVVLHDDPQQMPSRRACWSSWNVRRRGGESGVTYWMNRLQGIPETIPLFVTLNPIDEIPDAHIFDEVEFGHPMFDSAAIAAQRLLPGLQGVRDTYFCGAYARYGFHEDGLASALEAVGPLVRAPAPA